MKEFNYKTSQETFWASEFGDEYISRNKSPELLASKMAMFSKILQKTDGVASVVEFGCSIGLNLDAISMLIPTVDLKAIEINPIAAEIAKNRMPQAEIVKGSILEHTFENASDLAFTCGVMIHLNPEMLPEVYRKLANASRKYVLIVEYYNPSPVTIQYRGHEDYLFKRDFAGEFMEAHPEYQLVDYAFVYRKDLVFPLDDVTWFLLKK
jgi:pseudaminic acid biosynthesis-associated methylase